VTIIHSAKSCTHTVGTYIRNVRIYFCVYTSTHTLYSHVPDVVVRKASVGSGEHSEVPPGVKRLFHLIMPILLTLVLERHIHVRLQC